MRILLIKLGARGDVLRSTSILRALKMKYSDPTIDWVVDPSSSELLSDNPLIERVFVMPDKPDSEDYDLIINLDEDERACALVEGVFNREGFFIEGGRLLSSPSFDYLWRSGMYGPSPENDILKKKNINTYQELLFEALGLEGNPDPPIFEVSSDDLENADKFLSEASPAPLGFIGINFSSSAIWPAKRLPVARVLELTRYLEEKGFRVIIFGAEDEKDELKYLGENLDQAVIAESLPLGVFSALIAKLKLLISTDSFALHISAALKTPSLGLFGPTSLAEVDLFSNGEKLLAPLDCVCCYRKECDKEPFCMELFTPEIIGEYIKI